jgi:hypothetical protein
MRRAIVAFLALTSTGLILTGCGLFKFEQREAWRTQAEEACLAAGLVQPSAYASRTSPINGPGTCGIAKPFKVAALGRGEVNLDRTATLACPIIASTDTWLSEIVQPAAMLYFGSRVVEMRSGSYNCRTRNSQRGAKLSEHSFGNAIDIMSFQLSDGRDVTVLKGWKGDSAEQGFLREVFVGACRYYTTVLGPGADAFHYDHFHLDLARHDPAGNRRVCRPTLKYEPRIDPSSASAQMSPRPFGALPAVSRPQDSPLSRVLPALPAVRPHEAPPPGFGAPARVPTSRMSPAILPAEPRLAPSLPPLENTPSSQIGTSSPIY